MGDPALWFSTENVCARCYRPIATFEHLERWAREGMRVYNVDGEVTTVAPNWPDGTRDEPLWSARLCWAAAGGCMCDPGKVRARIRFLEIAEYVANERALK